MSITYIISLMFVATLGYLIFFLLSFPTPAMLGPFIFIILYSFFYNNITPLGSEFNFVLQVLLGLHIGILVNKQAFRNMKKLVVSSLIIITWTLAMTFGLGFFLTNFYQIDLATALLSTSPAGLAETGLLAVSVNADVGIVSLFQLSRMVLTILLVPIIVKYQKRENLNLKKSYTKRIRQRYLNVFSFKEKINYYDWNHVLIKSSTTIALGLLGGYLANKINIPAGALMGSFLIIAILCLSGVKLFQPPKIFKTLMQMGIGTSMAINVVQGSIYPIRYIFMPMIIFTFVMFLTSFFNAYIFKRINHWDNITCILASAPAGLTPMSILAYEHSENPLDVSIIHMTRLVIVKIIILPYIVYALMKV